MGECLDFGFFEMDEGRLRFDLRGLRTDLVLQGFKQRFKLASYPVFQVQVINVYGGLHQDILLQTPCMVLIL